MADKIQKAKSENARPPAWVLAVVTWFGSGLSPKAPGTVGSFTALPCAWGILALTDASSPGINMLIASFITFIIGWWTSSIYVRTTNSQDPGLIVIDEVAGIWLTISISIILTGHENYILSFIFFRIFDILKPWPIRWFDRSIHGGLGIMLDDMVAGALAAIPIYILQSLMPFPVP